MAVLNEGTARAGAADTQGTVVEAARRRGRASASNASGRFEPLTRSIIDDGWESVADLPPFKTDVVVEDQSLSRLRAWLHLLFCPSEPCLYGPVTGA